MTNKASIASAASTILGSVASVAEAAGKVVTDIASSTDMLTSFITIQKEQQRDRHILARRTYRANLIAEHNDQITKTQIELKAKFDSDPNYETLYTKNQAELEALFTTDKS